MAGRHRRVWRRKRDPGRLAIVGVGEGETEGVEGTAEAVVTEVRIISSLSDKSRYTPTDQHQRCSSNNLFVYGSNFPQSSTVEIDGAPVASTFFQNSGLLWADPGLAQIARTFSVTVPRYRAWIKCNCYR